MLVDTTARDTTTTLFGHKIAAPICIAPIGINKVSHTIYLPLVLAEYLIPRYTTRLAVLISVKGGA
jgi:hypothetical protein